MLRNPLPIHLKRPVSRAHGHLDREAHSHSHSSSLTHLGLRPTTNKHQASSRSSPTLPTLMLRNPLPIHLKRPVSRAHGHLDGEAHSHSHSSSLTPLRLRPTTIKRQASSRPPPT